MNDQHGQLPEGPIWFPKMSRMDSIGAALSQKAGHRLTPNPCPGSTHRGLLEEAIWWQWAKAGTQRRDLLARLAHARSSPAVGRLKWPVPLMHLPGDRRQSPSKGWRVPPLPMHPGGVGMLASPSKKSHSSLTQTGLGSGPRNVLICVQCSDLQPRPPSLWPSPMGLQHCSPSPASSLTVRLLSKTN